MTEAEWLACDDPEPLLLFLRERADDRKLRLYAAACCRCVGHLLPDPSSRRVVDVLERYADGRASAEELAAARGGIRRELLRGSNSAHAAAAVTIHKATGPAAWAAAWTTVPAALRTLRLSGVGSGPTLSRPLAALLRDLFGPLPFRPIAFEPVWRSSAVYSLASFIYETASFDRLPALALALQSRGCDIEELLSHCREPGPHVKGCWVVDTVLSKT
jgi:hypothetical protein